MNHLNIQERNLGSTCFLQRGTWISVVKIPKILSPVPAPKFGDFRGFSPKNPRNLNDPCPQTIPEPFGSSVPIPIPENWGFLGINPKNPQN